MIITTSSVSWIGGSHECDDDIQTVYLILCGLLRVLPFLSILPTLSPFLSESGEATPIVSWSTIMYFGGSLLLLY